jgi:hypothetical protein
MNVMAANTTARELNTHRYGLHLAKQLWYRGVAKKVIIVAVLAMIASLPAAGCISAPDYTRAPAAATAQLSRYRLAEYSLPHLPLATEGRLKIRRRRIREIVFSASAFEFKLSEFSAIVCRHET